MSTEMQQAMPDPPAFGLLIGAIGKTLVIAGAGAFLLSALMAVLPKKRSEGKSLDQILFWTGFICTVVVFLVHVGLILGAHYEFAYVFENSDNSMPFAFRLSAAWAAQEGSFLLWTVMSAVAGAVLMRMTGTYKKWFVASFGVVMGIMLGILAFESPFQLLEIDPNVLKSTIGATLAAVPTDGLGMNPVLQNLWMVIHPIVIFAGFGALTPLFCWSVSAAVSKDWSTWAVLIRPFVIATMIMLGLGLALGGLWAYETLGWGGFWAWDPVENVALIPWIAVIVLMHGLLIQVNRGQWARLNILLGTVPFSVFVYGTFLTRSGVLADVSVHSFAQMNEGAHGLLLWTLRGVLALLLFGTGFVYSREISTRSENPLRLAGHSRILILVSGAAVLVSAIALISMDGLDREAVGRVLFVLALGWLALCAGSWYGRKSSPAIAEFRTSEPGQRAVWLNVGAACLIVIGAATLIGTSFPFFANIFGEQAWVVSEVTYNKGLALPFVVAMSLIGIVPFLGWTKTAPGRIKRLVIVAIVSMLVTVGVIFFTPLNDMRISVLLWACVFAALASGLRVSERAKAKSGGAGAYITHSGVALMLLGLIVSRVFGVDQSAEVTVNSAGEVLGYEIALKSEPSMDELTTKDNRIQFEMTRGSWHQPISPVLYYDLGTDGEYHPVTRPYIFRNALNDLYFSVTSRLAAYKTNVGIDLNETVEIDRFKVHYIETERDEQGTLLSAIIEITDGDTTTVVKPQLVIEGDTVREVHAKVSEDLKIALHALDANSDRALVSLLPPGQKFTVQLLYRPLTILVWIGALLFSIGGFLAILKHVRRVKVR